MIRNVLASMVVVAGAFSVPGCVVAQDAPPIAPKPLPS